MRRRFSGLWRHPDFLKLWAGQTVSDFGTLVTRLALPFAAVIALQASPAQLGLLNAASIVPGFVAGLLAGVWVDRLRKRPLMIAADLGRATLLVSVPAAALLHALGLPQLYLVAFLVGLLSVFFDVAYESYLPALVRADQLEEGNSKLNASSSVAEVASFGLAGVLVQIFTAPGAILIDAISFLCSALSIKAIRAPEPPPQALHERRSLLTEAREGLGVVWHDPLLRTLAVCAALIALSSGIIGSLWELYTYRLLHQGPTVIGLLAATGGVGSFCGAAAASRVLRRLALGRALLVMLLIEGLGLLSLALASGPEVAVLLLLAGQQVLFDPAATIYQIAAVSLRQSITPARLQGRVAGTLRVVVLGAMLIGALAGGLFAQLAGVRASLLLAALWPFVAALWLLPTSLRRLRALPAAGVPTLD